MSQKYLNLGIIWLIFTFICIGGSLSYEFIFNNTYIAISLAISGIIFSLISNRFANKYKKWKKELDEIDETEHMKLGELMEYEDAMYDN